MLCTGCWKRPLDILSIFFYSVVSPHIRRTVGGQPNCWRYFEISPAGDLHTPMRRLNSTFPYRRVWIVIGSSSFNPSVKYFAGSALCLRPAALVHGGGVLAK